MEKKKLFATMKRLVGPSIHAGWFTPEETAKKSYVSVVVERLLLMQPFSLPSGFLYRCPSKDTVYSLIIVTLLSKVLQYG